MNLQQRIERLPVAYGIGISLFTAAVVFALVELRSVIVVVGSSLAGLAGICLLFVVHRLLQRRRAKRRSCALEAGIHRNMVEGGLTSEALRQKWDEGFGKARGKREVLADLPWYLLLGEPHAGKTEAIRPQHSGIGFEPALTDPYQGEGGTKYMDFWFANRAVILDMAGAVMFNEAGEKMFDATETVGPLWEEFLRLLAAHRPDYPINGVFLFIPMDTLISDTPDEIRKKAQTIAERFGTIRQALGVRFPVYVVVSKADKLVGFCEFFENLKDPDLQHQMFGWSNPTSWMRPIVPISWTTV
jgi:type VI secretion system protein ImpL